MSVNWFNPYTDTAGNWFRGNLHSHCLPKSPCAAIQLEALLAGYIAKKYDFLSISDHLSVTTAVSETITLFPGLEWNSRAGHMAGTVQTCYDHVGIHALHEDLVESSLRFRTLQELLDWQDNGVLRIANHPGWLEGEHYDLTTLMRFAGCLDGMEIYNHSIEADPGQADSTWKWDCLLSMGCPLLGFAHDDAHCSADIGKAWLMVRAENNSPAEIFKSLKRGNFYCSSGVSILNLERTEATIQITLEEDANIRVIGNFGRVLQELSGKTMKWSFTDDAIDYARFHVRNSAWQQGWSQPFYK